MVVHSFTQRHNEKDRRIEIKREIITVYQKYHIHKEWDESRKTS